MSAGILIFLALPWAGLAVPMNILLSRVFFAMGRPERGYSRRDGAGESAADVFGAFVMLRV